MAGTHRHNGNTNAHEACSEKVEGILSSTYKLHCMLYASPVVAESISIYSDAPLLVKNRIHSITGSAKRYIGGMITVSMRRFINEEDLESLSMIAAIEEVRTSPLHMGFLRDEARKKDVLEHIRFNDWACKNMPGGSYNIMISARNYKVLEKDRGAIETHMFVAPMVARKKVLAAMGTEGKNIESILRTEYNRETSGMIPPELFERTIKLLRATETQVKVPMPGPLSMQTKLAIN